VPLAEPKKYENFQLQLNAENYGKPIDKTNAFINENDLDKYDYHKNILRYKKKVPLVPDEYSFYNLINGKHQRPSRALAVGSTRGYLNTVATPDFLSQGEIPNRMNQTLVSGQEMKPRASGFKKPTNVGNKDSVFVPGEMIDIGASELKSINVTPNVTSNLNIQVGQVKKGLFPDKNAFINTADISNPEGIQTNPVKGNNMILRIHNYVLPVNTDEPGDTLTAGQRTIDATVKVKPPRFRKRVMMRPAGLQNSNAEKRLNLQEKNFLKGDSTQPSKRSQFRVEDRPGEGVTRVLGEKEGQKEIEGNAVPDF
jgi:hypothetical protein